MNAIKEKAVELQEQLGGSIFAFPIDEQDPFSKYAVVVYVGGLYHTYPTAENISGAALGVKTILEEFKKIGQDVSFEKDVRLVSYQAQVDAPDVTMRRLKKGNFDGPALQEGNDFHKGDKETGELVSARGVLKLSYLEMVDNNNPKAIWFMDEYYKLLAMRKYGKTASAIKQEVKRMGKGQAVKWIEQTYQRFIRDDMEIMNIMQALKD